LWAADGNELRFRLFVRSEWGWRGVGTRSYAAMFGPSYVEGDTTRAHWMPVGLAPDMRVVARVEASIASRTVQATRERALVLLRSPTTGRVDTLAQLVTSRAWMLIHAVGGAQRRTVNPLRYGDLVAMDGSGQRIVVVNLPTANDTTHDDRSVMVSSWRSDGSVVFKRSFAVGLTTITTAALDSFARSLRVVDRRGYPVQRAAPSESFAAGLRNANPQGSMHAPIDRLVIGRDGTIWLREEAAGGRGWVVLSAHGLPIGRVRFPENRRGVLLAADSQFAWMLEPLGLGQFQVAKYRMASMIPADGSP
jgi:hypothetical protein